MVGETPRDGSPRDEGRDPLPERLVAGYPYSPEAARQFIDMMKEWFNKMRKKSNDA